MNDNVFILGRLGRPAYPADVVLDTDAFNEIDDQYALAWLLKSAGKLNAQAVYAAPFSNRKAATPAEGMEKSFDEIARVATLCGRGGVPVCRGARAYLPEDGKTPVDSDAARDLVRRAMARGEDGPPLYVAAIAAATNVASALLIEPEIAKRIVVVWLGGHAVHWPEAWEFNMSQDMAAARVVFGSGVPLVHIPCMGAASGLITTGPEIQAHLSGKNALCDYLCEITIKEANPHNNHKTWSRVIWDAATIAWLLDDRFTAGALTPAPIPTRDGYAFDNTRHLIRSVYWLNRDAVFEAMFTALLSSES